MDERLEETLLSPQQRNLEVNKVYEESKKIWRVAFPSLISGASSFGTMVITQSFIWHISSNDLAAYALVESLTARFAVGLIIGLSSATETLCGQAFGAKQYHMLGIFLQRSWIVDLIVMTTILPLFIFATPIFRLLGEGESIAKSTGHISLWFIPYLYSLVFSMTMVMYLQSQQKNMIVAWLSATQFVIHLLLSWIFVYVMNWGTAGAVSSLGISSWFVVLGEFVYVFGGWCPDSWKGFNLAAFNDLIPVMKLSISSAFMLCLEIWYYGVLVLLAGYMKNAKVAISAFAICINVSTWEFTISIALMGAAIVRVANELGRGDAKAIKYSIKVLISTCVAVASIFCILCLLFGNKLGHLFSSDEDVIATVSDLSIPLAFSILLNGLYPVLSGVAVGSGMQTKVAIINLVCYYMIGLPIGAVLCYVANLQLKGIWIGMICGVLAQTLAISFMTWKTNWDQEVVKTADRLQRWYLKSKDENEQSSNHA